MLGITGFPLIEAAKVAPKAVALVVDTLFVN